MHASSKHLKHRKECVNYKGETEGVPLFTSPTLNISRIEVEYRGFKCLEAKEERNE